MNSFFQWKKFFFATKIGAITTEQLLPNAGMIQHKLCVVGTCSCTDNQRRLTPQVHILGTFPPNIPDVSVKEHLKVGQTICIESKEMGIGLQSNKKLGSAQISLHEFGQELKLLCFYKRSVFTADCKTGLAYQVQFPTFVHLCRFYLHHHDANLAAMQSGCCARKDLDIVYCEWGNLMRA